MTYVLIGGLLLAVGMVVACSDQKSDNGGAALSGSGGGGQPGDGAIERPDCLPNVPLECVEEMCRKEKFNCGDPASILDALGCYRAKCSASTQCSAGEECREVTYGPVTCGFAPPNDQVCSCGNSLSLVTETRCFPAP